MSFVAEFKNQVDNGPLLPYWQEFKHINYLSHGTSVGDGNNVSKWGDLFLEWMFYIHHALPENIQAITDNLHRKKFPVILQQQEYSSTTIK